MPSSPRSHLRGRAKPMRHCGPISLLLAAIGLAGGMASAQVERAGLESTGDEALVQELARYDLNTLLEHYFQEQPAAAGKYASVRATLAVRMLCSGEALGLEQRRQAVRRVVEGGDAAISPISDPRQLMQLGTALIRDGAEPEADAIEYWGDSPSTRSSLRSVAAAVIHVLDLAASRTRAEADRLAEALGNAPSVQQQRQYTAMDSLAANARYTRLMAEYYRVLVLDPADKARPAAARTAIAATPGV